MLAELNLRLTLEEATQDYYNVHGYALTLMELERQIERLKRQYADELTEPPDDGRGIPRDQFFDALRKRRSGRNHSLVDG